jgi:hypothetical protein
VSDDSLMNEMLATTHLIDCAEDWGRICDNPTLPWPVREDARRNAACIWAELGMENKP